MSEIREALENIWRRFTPPAQSVERLDAFIELLCEALYVVGVFMESVALTYFEDLLLSPELAGPEALLPAPAEVGGGLSWEARLFPDPYPPFRRLVLRPDEPFPDVLRAMPNHSLPTRR